MATIGNSRRGGQVYGTGPDWEIIKYEYQSYTPHKYEHAREYNHVTLPKTVHTYEGHSYNKLRKWDDIRTYEPKEYRPQFYKAPRHKPPPSKIPPPRKSRPRKRDHQWAKLYKCYEEPIGPERTVRECPLNDYKNHDYNPAMRKYEGDKVMYMDREFKTYLYTGSVHYTLTDRNFYPYSMMNKYEHQKDVNGNISKEPTVASLKEVKLQEEKKDINAVILGGAVVPKENKDVMQVMNDSSWDKEELKQEEPPPPQPIREDTPKQTMSASHGVKAEDRLTPVNTVVATGAIATVANTSDIKKDETEESDRTEQKSDVKETNQTSSNKINEPVYVAPIAAAAVAVPAASTKTPSPVPSRSSSVSSVRSNRSSTSVPGGLVIAGAVVASEMQSKNNPPPPQQNNTSQVSKDEPKPPPEINEKAPSPTPVVPLVAAAAVGATSSTTAPKQPTPEPKHEAPQPSPAKSPSPTQVAAVPVAATAAAVSQPTGTKAAEKPTASEEPVQEQKNPIVETSNPQNAAKPSTPSKTNLPPEVIATIEAYDAAHDGKENDVTLNSVGTVKRTIQLTT